MEQSYVSWFVALDFFAYLCPRLLNVFMYEEMKKVVFPLIVGAVSCAVMAQTTGVETGHGWVDLGLPSGLKWATMNIGAAAPQDDGDYYAWGETAQKTDFRWATYLHGASQNALSKYTQTDGLMLLAQADDVVSQTWGGAWRMPTQAEWAELKTHCVWTWTDNYNATGVAGYEVASQSGDASLFLPAAGCRYANRVNEKGVHGYYWSSSLSDVSAYWGSAYQMQFVQAYAKPDWNHTRYYGSSVRGVCVPQQQPTGVESVAASPIVCVEAGTIRCGQAFRIYDVTGRDVTWQNGALPNGVYMVQVGEKTEKVMVF